MRELLDAMARQGFEEVVAIHDRDSGLRAFLGIHDSRRGTTFGGIRRWNYRDEGQALRDCLRLSRAMTHKCALVDLPAGGAKIVILDGRELQRERAYSYIGSVLERLKGRMYAGPDVGTNTHELAWLSAETSYVTDPGPEGPGQLAESTCVGVFAGMEASLEHLDGEVDWPRRTVVVQGLGETGLGLVRMLLERGARVLAADIDPVKARAARGQLDFEPVDAAREYDVECDIFAPCAMGGVLHDLTVPRLRCRIVAGSANNMLASPNQGERLHERGVLIAPDFVINSGALIRGALFHLEGRRESLERIGERIGGTLTGILVRAREDGRSPSLVALDEAEERVSAWQD